MEAGGLKKGKADKEWQDTGENVEEKWREKQREGGRETEDNKKSGACPLRGVQH